MRRTTPTEQGRPAKHRRMRRNILRTDFARGRSPRANFLTPRVYLKTENVTGSEEFSRCARHFFRRNTDVFQGKMTRRGVKRPAVRVRWEFSDTP